MRDFVVAALVGLMVGAGVVAGTLLGEPVIVTGPALWWLA
jgi:hypothetical protein